MKLQPDFYTITGEVTNMTDEVPVYSKHEHGSWNFNNEINANDAEGGATKKIVM